MLASIVSWCRVKTASHLSDIEACLILKRQPKTTALAGGTPPTAKDVFQASEFRLQGLN